MADQATSHVPFGYRDWTEAIRRTAFAINRLLEGKSNNTGSVTLETSQLTTTLNDKRIGANSVVILVPSNANAGGEVGIYIDGYGKQTCTINHGSDSRTRTFKYVVVG